MDVVVVESPTKAKTIAKYLGDGYQVLASYGHVRDLPESEGSVLPDEDFLMHWEPLKKRGDPIGDIAKALKHADHLFLATDPDREGEAISWHLFSVLDERGAINGVDVKRVVFHEVTKRAVEDAIAHSRALDENLIDAYRARRALDYLVGYTLSPVLWRKLPGSRSAGRVQSVALRLICERESEIEAFELQEYWTIEALLQTPRAEEFKARLSHLDGKKLDKFDLANEAQAKAAVAAIERSTLAVVDVEKKQVGRNPAPPFSTSTLQQEASRKLGFSADRTMKTAQRLFEGINVGGETVGLITYMRTDSVQISNDAMSACRKVIDKRYGANFVPEKPRFFKTRTKNAQEAHEAIRPTDLFRAPDGLSRALGGDEGRLYDLIWRRTLASQMAAAQMNRVGIDIKGPEGNVMLRATGQTIAFEGFLKVYREGRDEVPEDDDEGRILPEMAAGEALRRRNVEAAQHHTEPPPRFTEASLVKRLEELGIGRPSTYANIISVLQDRDYVRLEQKRFVPEDRGRIVTAFLTDFFDRYVRPDFTADLENKLDGVAGGELRWKDVLREFWDPFFERTADVKERRTAEVIDALNTALARKLFPPRPDGADARLCPLCEDGNLSLKLGRFGAFIGCSNYPRCRYTRQLGEGADDGQSAVNRDRMIGVDPGNDEEVWLKKGRYGSYLQRGTGDEPKRSSLPPNVVPEEIDLEFALRILALPREVGQDPESKKPVIAGINRYGPFIELDGKFVRLAEDDDVLAIGMNRALHLLAEAKPARGQGTGSTKPLKELGEHPHDKKPVTILAGRFGPYIKHAKTNVSLPKSLAPEDVDLEKAIELIAAKEERSNKGGGKGKKAAKATKTKASETKAPPKRKAAAKSAGSKAKKSGSAKAAGAGDRS